MKRLASLALLLLAPAAARAQWAHPTFSRPYPTCTSASCTGCPRPTPGVPMQQAPAPQIRVLPSPSAAFSVARPAPAPRAIIWYRTLPTRVR